LERFLEKCSKLTVGEFGPDIGPMITKEARDRALGAIQQAQAEGARLLFGGCKPSSPELSEGNYLVPTVLQIEPDSDAQILEQELFGPVVTIQRVATFEQAMDLASSSQYGLTSAIHTTDWNRALRFAMRMPVGVVSVNGGTFGSEPHMPFGGRGMSGNGTREPGTEALDIYSELKVIYMNFVE
jgi:aldehyde dehydrogenase (NAD+)